MKASPKYSAIHAYLSYHNKKTGICDFCQKPNKMTHWAKKTESEYTRNREDYFELCSPCHQKYDFTDERREQLSKSHIGIKNPHKRQAVRATKDGVSTDYASVQEAAKALNMAETSITHVLGGNRNSVYGYNFERI